MVRQRSSIACWVFVAAFVFFAAGINFLHTDGLVEHDPFCPACQFQSSLIEPVELFVLAVPLLAVLAAVSIAAAVSHDVALMGVEPARGPPVF